MKCPSCCFPGDIIFLLTKQFMIYMAVHTWLEFIRLWTTWANKTASCYLFTCADKWILIRERLSECLNGQTCENDRIRTAVRWNDYGNWCYDRLCGKRLRWKITNCEVGCSVSVFVTGDRWLALWIDGLLLLVGTPN